MIFSQRVIWSDNGTLRDITPELNDFRAGSVTFNYVAGQDYLFVGSYLPCNHRYFDLGAPNIVAATPSVDIWWANAWTPAVDIIDQTALSGASLGQSAILRWNTNRLKGWDYEQDSADVTGLTGTAIYNMFWLRFSWSASLTGSMTLKYIGQKFATDADLYSLYPDLNNSALKVAFAAGKTTWDEQHFVAADVIARELRNSQIIRDKNQILDDAIFNVPAIHRAAALIYGGLGRAYLEDKKEAEKEYRNAMKMKNFHIDLDADGSLAMASPERSVSTGFLSR
jgi:hypothetical protein